MFHAYCVPLTDCCRTKPGIHHAKKRDKPLKTYGKRQASASQSPVEPARKRVRFAEELEQRTAQIRDSPTPTAAVSKDTSLEEKEHDAPSNSESNLTKDTPSKDTPADKQSILNYFKRLPPSTPSKPTPLSKQQEEPEHPHTPPKKRVSSTTRRRVLRIRSTTSSPVSCLSNDEQDGGSSDDNEQTSPLSEGGEPLHNQQRTRGSKALQDRKAKRARLATQVQTTLNISSQAAFSECKVCDTVWNPLYPDDVKYHTKRHAAQLKANKRAAELEL